MDWARVKTILIVVFFIVNVFLIVNLIQKNKGTELKPEEIKSVKELLAQKNIMLDTEIEKKVLNLSRINVVNQLADEDLAADKFIGKGIWRKNIDAKGNTLYSSNKENLMIQKNGEGILTYTEAKQKLSDLTDNKLVNEYMLGALRKYNITEAVLQTESKHVNTYNNRYVYYSDKCKVFNNYAEIMMDVASGKVSIKVGIIDFEGYTGKAKQVSVIDSLIELIKNVDLKKQITIKKISLGYYADVDKNNETIKYGEADPAWEMETDDGIYIFNGYSGKLVYKYRVE